VLHSLDQLATACRSTPDQITLSHEMGLWWASLNAAHDPNSKARDGAPNWPPYNPVRAAAIMYLGSGPDPLARTNVTEDSVDAECENWRTFLGA
jgi:hypothetical protein